MPAVWLGSGLRRIVAWEGGQGSDGDATLANETCLNGAAARIGFVILVDGSLSEHFFKDRKIELILKAAGRSLEL